MFTFPKLLEHRKTSRHSRGKARGRYQTRLGFESLERRELLSVAPLVPQINVLHQVQGILSDKTTKGDGFVYYQHGNAAVGREVNLTGGLALEGGGKDVDQVYESMGAKANGGDFLVPGTDGNGSYDSYIYNLNAKNPSKIPTAAYR